MYLLAKPANSSRAREIGVVLHGSLPELHASCFVHNIGPLAEYCGPSPLPVRASHWGVLPSRGTEAHSVLLLKTSLALYGGEYIVLEVRGFY